MRSFSDVDFLIVALLVLTACVLLNFQPIYDVAEWVVKGGLSILLAECGHVPNIV